MSRIQKIVGTVNNPVPTTQNMEGYPAFQLSDKLEYVKTLLTNSFGQTFYASAKEMVEQAKKLHQDLTIQDPEFVAKAVVYARNAGYMRSQPIFGLASLCSFKGTEKEVERRRKLARSVFGKVVKTPNDLADFIAVCKSLGNNLNSRSMKGMVNGWLESNFGEYWAIKYGSASKEISMRSILRHFHPAHKNLFRYLRAKKDGFEVDLTELPQIRAFEALKVAKTDSEKIQAIVEGKLPHEVATSFAGSSKEVWKTIAQQMPIMALLKNLATLERHGVVDDVKEYVKGKLSNKNAVIHSQILPFRFLKAMEMVASAWVKDCLRDAVELSFENIPKIEGKTVVMLDISGSMNGEFLQTASIFAISLMKQAELNGKLLCFDTSSHEVSVSMRDSILTQAQKIRTAGGTDTSSPIKQLLKEGYNCDNIIMITDEQQNSGGLMFQALQQYMRTINKDVKFFVVDVSPYKGGSIPETMKNGYYIYGWSDQVLNFISMASKGFKSIVEVIEKS